MTYEELKAKCEGVLQGENFDLNPWRCPACGENSSRAWFVAAHILEHMRKAEWEDAQKREELRRQIEVD